MRWSVVVPVKRLSEAKSRLALESAPRQSVALAMTLDTVSAALACQLVARVVAVSDDDRAGAELVRLGALVVPDRPRAGLNPALAYGARLAARLAPGCGVAALSSDLPALRSGELAAALDAAAGHPVGLIADAAGTGTTLLTARPGVALPVSFGPNSRAGHLVAGAVELQPGGLDGLRHDVDTIADLAAVRSLGLGRATAAALAAAAGPTAPR